MSDALEDHNGSVRTGGRIFITFRFTDDILLTLMLKRKLNDIMTSMNDHGYNLYKVKDGD